MLKRLVTISIVPSRLKWIATLVAAACVCLVVGRYGPAWLVIAAVGALSVTIWHGWRREDEWQLRWVPGAEGGWQYRLGGTGDWLGVTLYCDYLSPWLIGLKVAGRRYWLWPDSASYEARRALRRLLLWVPSVH